MKGLLVKDFLCIKQQAKISFISLIFLAVFSVTATDEGVIGISCVAAAMVLGSMMSLFSFDEQAKWDTFALSLPMKKGQIVFEKYIFMFIITVAASLFSGILGFVLQQASNIEMFLTFAAVCAGTSVVMNSVMLPFIYKFGERKAMFMFFAVLFSALIVIFALRGMHPNATIKAGISRNIPFISVITAIILIISYLISCGIVKNKEV